MRGILFDMGGTLLTREPPDHVAWGEAVRTAGLALDAAAILHAWRAAEAWVRVQSLAEVRGAPWMPEDEFLRARDRAGLRAALPAASAKRLEELVRALCSVPPLPRPWKVVAGVKALLATLAGRGYRLGVVSNWDLSLRPLLEELELASLFQALIISAEVGVAKPDPRILRLGCEALGLPPAEVLYVGDHPLDIACAIEAGVAVAWLAPEDEPLPPDLGYAPDLRLTCLAQLADVVS